MKLLNLVFIFVFIFVVSIVYCAPSKRDFENTIETTGVVVRLTNGKTSTSTINGHPIYSKVGVIGGGDSLILPDGIENEKLVTARVTHVKSLFGQLWVAVEIKSADSIYYIQTPAQCVTAWRQETLLQTIEWMAVVLVISLFFTKSNGK